MARRERCPFPAPGPCRARRRAALAHLGDAAREGATVRDDSAAPAHRFPLVPFDQIALHAGSPYLIRGLIPRDGLVVIWGAPKSGKTFWTFDLAMHVALGWSYRDRRVAAGAVVYIACEGERGL